MSVRHTKSGGVFETTHINTSTALLHEGMKLRCTHAVLIIHILYVYYTVFTSDSDTDEQYFTVVYVMLYAVQQYATNFLLIFFLLMLLRQTGHP